MTLGEEMPDPHVNYYRVLGVPRNASMPEIRRAYRRLARQHHPDISPRHAGQHEFVALAQAYEVLRDPAERARYDHQLGTPRRPRYEPHQPPRESPAPHPRWVPWRGQARSAILELSPREARLVASAPLTLIDGRGLAIELPAGTREGDRLRLGKAAAAPWEDLVLTVLVKHRSAPT